MYTDTISAVTSQEMKQSTFKGADDFGSVIQVVSGELGFEPRHSGTVGFPFCYK